MNTLDRMIHQIKNRSFKTMSYSNLTIPHMEALEKYKK